MVTLTMDQLITDNGFSLSANGLCACSG